jgi:hypothetical protein
LAQHGTQGAETRYDVRYDTELPGRLVFLQVPLKIAKSISHFARWNRLYGPFPIPADHLNLIFYDADVLANVRRPGDITGRIRIVRSVKIKAEVPVASVEQDKSVFPCLLAKEGYRQEPQAGAPRIYF